MNKKIIAIITSIIMALVVAIPVNAVEFTQAVGFIGNWNVQTSWLGGSSWNCSTNNSSQPAEIYNAGTTPCANTLTINGVNGIGYNGDYIFQVDIAYYDMRDREALHAYINTTPTITLIQNSGNVQAQILGNNVNNISESSAIYSIYFRIPVNGATSITAGYFSVSTQIGLQPNERAMGPTAIRLWAKENLSANIAVNIDNSALIRELQEANTKLGYVDGWLAQINSKMDNVASNVNQQQQQAGEQAQQDGQQSANQGQQSAESATQNGFQTLGTIIGAFTDTPSGDCTINGNLGNVDLGTLNLCQGNIEPIRPVIRAVIYLVMALGTYKLVMWIIGSIAGLVNYVQTGNEE